MLSVCALLFGVRVGLVPTRPKQSCRALDFSLDLAGFFSTNGPNARDTVSGADGVIIQLPLPHSHPGGPAETVTS